MDERTLEGFRLFKDQMDEKERKTLETLTMLAIYVSLPEPKKVSLSEFLQITADSYMDQHGSDKNGSVDLMRLIASKIDEYHQTDSQN